MRRRVPLRQKGSLGRSSSAIAPGASRGSTSGSVRSVRSFAVRREGDARVLSGTPLRREQFPESNARFSSGQVVCSPFEGDLSDGGQRVGRTGRNSRVYALEGKIEVDDWAPSAHDPSAPARRDVGRLGVTLGRVPWISAYVRPRTALGARRDGRTLVLVPARRAATCSRHPARASRTAVRRARSRRAQVWTRRWDPPRRVRHRIETRRV
jgi:hypothetical protein